jgi:hypothetical protein
MVSAGDSTWLGYLDLVFDDFGNVISWGGETLPLGM